MSNLEDDSFIIEKNRYHRRTLKEWAAMAGGAAIGFAGAFLESSSVTVAGAFVMGGAGLSMAENSRRNDRTIHQLNVQSKEESRRL